MCLTIFLLLPLVPYSWLHYTYHMQMLPSLTDSAGGSLGASADELAALTLETIPSVMRVIRTFMRAEAEGETTLTIPQFRALGFIERRTGSSLGDVAEHLGIPMSGASRLIQTLVRNNLVVRTPDSKDRRKVTLSLLPTGKNLRIRARQHTQRGLDDLFQRLTPDERKAIAVALPILRELFTGKTSTPSSESPAAKSEAPPPA